MRVKQVREPPVSFDLSIGDLMSGLLLIFILLLTSTLFKLQQEFEQKSNITQEYRKGQELIFKDLENEFSEDLEKWGAEIDPVTLAFRFKNPDLLFLPNQAELRPAFKNMLAEFFPRYIHVLYPKYDVMIEEIRIEGHTAKDNTFSYLNHMELSQKRTNEVLQFVLGKAMTDLSKTDIGWVHSCLSASGLAYSKPILVNGIEDWNLSRRVEFRIRTNSEKKIQELLEIGGGVTDVVAP